MIAEVPTTDYLVVFHNIILKTLTYYWKYPMWVVVHVVTFMRENTDVQCKKGYKER